MLCKDQVNDKSIAKLINTLANIEENRQVEREIEREKAEEQTKRKHCVTNYCFVTFFQRVQITINV